MDTKLLESLLAEAMPAMDGLKRIAAEDWSVDMPADGGWSFLGREDNSPRIIVIERGFGRSADARHNAIESLIALAPTLAREVIELRRKVEAAENLAEAAQNYCDYSSPLANLDHHRSFREALAAWDAAR